MSKRVLALIGVTMTAAVLATGARAEELVKYTIDKKGYTIPQSLTGKPGDPVKGREVAIDRRKGNCLSCHKMPVPEQPFHGAIGPPLTGVGARYSAEQLRLRIVDAKMFNPHTIMPSFYKVDGFHRPLEKFAGKPILSAQEVEDVIAYLGTIK
jgi:sulfur-oxidizing protein SoxX